MAAYGRKNECELFFISCQGTHGTVRFPFPTGLRGLISFPGEFHLFLEEGKHHDFVTSWQDAALYAVGAHRQRNLIMCHIARLLMEYLGSRLQES